MSVLGELAAVELERAIAALRALWIQLRGEARVPLRSAFSPELLKPWLPNIVIVEVVGTPTSSRPNSTRSRSRPYVRAIAAGVPMEDDILNHQFIAPDGISLPVRRPVLPCSSDGVRIDRFVVRLFLYRPESR